MPLSINSTFSRNWQAANNPTTPTTGNRPIKNFIRNTAVLFSAGVMSIGNRLVSATDTTDAMINSTTYARNNNYTLNNNFNNPYEDTLHSFIAVLGVTYFAFLSTFCYFCLKSNVGACKPQKIKALEKKLNNLKYEDLAITELSYDQLKELEKCVVCLHFSSKSKNDASSDASESITDSQSSLYEVNNEDQLIIYDDKKIYHLDDLIKAVKVAEFKVPHSREIIDISKIKAVKVVNTPSTHIVDISENDQEERIEMLTKDNTPEASNLYLESIV